MARDIRVALELENSKFNRSIAQSERQVDNFSKNSTAGIGRIGAALTALGGTTVLKGIIDVGSEFQGLQNSLNVVFGGLEQGADAFDRVTNFAQNTQFSVQTLTQAFVQLKGAGVEPTEELLMTFADTASVTTDQMGTFQAALDLVSRSTAGGLGLEDLNRLADRGIPVFNILQERLGLTRLEVSEFGKTADGANTIIRELLAGLQEDFGGALVTRLDDFEIVASNLGIAFDKLKVALFGTFSDDATNAVKGLTDAINKLADNVAPIVQLGKGLAQIFAVATLIFPFARALRAASTAMFSLQRGTSIFAAGGGGLIGLLTKIGGSVKKFLLAPFTAAGKAIGRLFRKEGPDDILSGLGRLKLAAQKIGEGFLWIGGTVLGIKGLQNAMEGASDVAETFAEKMGPPRELFEQNLQKVIDEYNELTDNDTLFDELPKQIVKASTALQDYLKVLDDVVPSATTFEEQLTKLNDALGNPKTVKEIKDYESALGALKDAFGVNEEFDKLKESFEDVDSIEEYNTALATLNGLLNSGKISATEFKKAKEELDEKLGDNQSLLDFIATLNTATDTLADDLAVSLMEGKSVLDDFKNFFKTLVQQIIADAIKMLFIIPILQAIGFSVGPTGTIAGFSGKGLLGNLGVKATGAGGGAVMANRPMLIGEQGMEIFTPSSSGTITPNHQMGTNVYYTINATDPASFQAQLSRDPQFVHAIVQKGQNSMPSGRRF